MKKNRSIDFYTVASQLTGIKLRNKEIQIIDLGDRVEFYATFSRIIKATAEKLGNNNIDEKSTMMYWSKFIQCFVKLEPLNKTDDYPRFRSDVYPCGVISKIYPKEIYLKKLALHNKEWNIKE